MTNVQVQQKRTLNDILADFHALDDLLVETDGEITPEMEEMMYWLQGQLEDKLDGYQSFIEYLNGQMDYLKQAEEELARRRRIIDNSVKRLKTRMIDAMNMVGVEKIKTPRHSYSLRMTESIDIDGQGVPDNLFKSLEERGMARTELLRRFDKMAIKKHYNGNYPKWVKSNLKLSITVR